MMNGMRPSVILLREGTDTSQGKAQLISNINACNAVADVIRSTLGPRGMDKLIHTETGATISNDGAEILKLLDIVHPAAKTLVDIAKAQDAEVGDGTTSVTLLAAELLNNARSFIEDGQHPQVIIQGYRKACMLAVNRMKELQVGIGGLDGSDKESRRTLLERVASTALNSKLICRNKGFFAPICVDAVDRLDHPRDLKLVGIKKVTGGSVTESELIQGVAFKKTFSYAGFEQQPKKLENPKILLLNVELELKSEKENAEIRISDPSQYQSIVDAEWKIIFDKMDACIATGATIVLSRLPIGDLATQYFADRNVFCAGRVADDDMVRVVKATGGVIQTSMNNIPQEVLGSCSLFEERQVGGERYNFFLGCTHAKTATIILRGGSEQFVEEAHRSLHDALMVVKRSMEHTSVVAGGGAVEMEVSRNLRNYARGIEGKQQLIITQYAKALEVIPKTLCDNAGFDSTDVLNKLRTAHREGGDNNKWIGVDVNTGGVCDTFESLVWEPASSKLNSYASATEAACLVLSVDETIRNPQSEQAKMQGRGQTGGGGGNLLSAAMGGGGMMGMGRGMAGRGIRTMKGRGGK